MSDPSKKIPSINIDKWLVKISNQEPQYGPDYVKSVASSRASETAKELETTYKVFLEHYTSSGPPRDSIDTSFSAIHEAMTHFCNKMQGKARTEQDKLIRYKEKLQQRMHRRISELQLRRPHIPENNNKTTLQLCKWGSRPRMRYWISSAMID